MPSEDLDDVSGNVCGASAPMPIKRAQSLISFANAHNDGSPQPRAYYDSRLDQVVVTSTEYHISTRQHRLVQQGVRSFSELRALLGY
jgi:hypothetical protein